MIADGDLQHANSNVRGMKPQSWQTIRLNCDRLHLQPVPQPYAGAHRTRPRASRHGDARAAVADASDSKHEDFGAGFHRDGASPISGVNHVHRKFSTARSSLPPTRRKHDDAPRVGSVTRFTWPKLHAAVRTKQRKPISSCSNTSDGCVEMTCRDAVHGKLAHSQGAGDRTPPC